MEGKLKAKTVTADDEGRCKAAAWAWYQHGKGTPSNGGLACRTLNSAVRRASRFKVEAMREQGRFVEGWTGQEQEQHHHQQHHQHMHEHEHEQEQHHQQLYEQQEREEHGRPEMASGHEHEEEEEHAEPGWDCGSSLFDSYELFALSRQLDHAFVKASGANHAVHEPHFEKKSQKLGKILKMMPRGPRPLCRSEVMLQHPAQTHDPDLEGHLPGCKCHRHESEEEHHYGYRDQGEHGGYQAEHADWEEDHHGAHNYHHKDADHHHRRRHGHGHGHGHGKHHWSFRKLSRALLMLAHKPTSVSHHNDEAQGHHHHNRGADSEDFHHQHHHEHYHEHDYHHQHEFRHQHEFHHYHHVHHIIQASPKLGYDVSEPPKFHSDG